MTTRINTMNSEASSLSRPQLDLMDDPLAPQRARHAFTGQFLVRRLSAQSPQGDVGAGPASTGSPKQEKAAGL